MIMGYYIFYGNFNKQNYYLLVKSHFIIKQFFAPIVLI